MLLLETAPVDWSTTSPPLKRIRVGMARISVFSGGGGVLVNVHFDDFHLTIILFGKFVDDRTHGTARATPGSPEVNKDGDIALQDFLFKIAVSNLIRHTILLFFPAGAVIFAR